MATLGAKVLHHQVGGDAVQPGSCISSVEPVPVPALERDAKQLAQQSLAICGTDSTDEIGHERWSVPVVHARERRRIGQRELDQPRIVNGRFHDPNFPATDNKLTTLPRMTDPRDHPP
jgi:hypothetical protein